MDRELHSPEDDELERRDQQSFSRVVVVAGVAIMVILVLALLVVRFAGGHIRPVYPDRHPASHLVVGQQNRRAG